MNPESQHCWGKDTKTYVDLDNLLHARSGSFHDSLDVVAAGLGQLADVTLDRVGGGVVGDLAGDEDLAVGADSLGLYGVSIFRPIHVWLGCVLWDSGFDVVVGVDIRERVDSWGFIPVSWGIRRLKARDEDVRRDRQLDECIR